MRSGCDVPRRVARTAREATAFAVKNALGPLAGPPQFLGPPPATLDTLPVGWYCRALRRVTGWLVPAQAVAQTDRKSTRLNSSHLVISYAVFCLKKKNRNA